MAKRLITVEEVLARVTSIARNWQSAIMKQHLDGAKTFAKSLLIDLPSGINATDAERMVEEAAAEAPEPPS